MAGASGVGGAAGMGAAGVAGVGGVAGAEGTGGIGGVAGAAGAAGGGGVGTPEVCSFAIAGALSPAIPTVGIVNWSTDLAELSEARLEFTLNDPAADEINRGSGGEIDVAGATHRALLLGLKAERTYTYRIVATGGGKVCTSADQTLTTGPPTNAPTVTRTANDPTAQARGFIVTCEFTGGSSQPRPRMAYIVDADGDVVWWTPEPTSCSRALIDWEGANMWMVQGTSGAANTVVQRIGMDGTGEQNVPELARAHHDIAALPGGIVATLVWVEGNTAMYGSNLVERLPDGTVKTVVRLDDKIFKPTDTGLFHANSILYHRADDTYTVGDAYGAYVKLTRQGRPLWQFARDCTGAPVPKCATGTLSGNHGHHLLANGNILFMNARPDVQIAPVYEYSLTETASTLTATRVWSYTAPNNLSSYALGDVQRLPNGNTLVTFSTRGQIHEISPSGGLVQAIAAATSFPYFAYADFRETLYGPPLR